MIVNHNSLYVQISDERARTFLEELLERSEHLIQSEFGEQWGLANLFVSVSLEPYPVAGSGYLVKVKAKPKGDEPIPREDLERSSFLVR